MPYYLASYIGRGTDTDRFRPSVTEPGWSAIDLRPDGGATLDGGGLNACFLHLSTASADPSLMLIGLDPADTLGPMVVRALNGKLRTTVHPGRLDTILASLLISPPAHGWNPLLPGVDHPREIWLGNLFWRESLAGANDPAWMRLKHWDRLTLAQRYLYNLWIGDYALSPWTAFKLARRGCLPIRGGVLPATDDFNRADEAPLSNGGKWSTQFGSATNPRVVANQCTSTIASDRGAFWNADVFANDHYGQAVVSVFGAGGLGASCRASGTTLATTNLYWWDHTAANTNTIDKYVNGTGSLLKTTNLTFAANDTTKVDVSGSTIRVYRNGSQVDSTTDLALTSGSAGLKLGDATGILDNWQGDNVTASTGPGTYLLYAGVP